MYVGESFGVKGIPIYFFHFFHLAIIIYMWR